MLTALQSRLLTPELVEHFVRTFEAEVTRRQREAAGTEARAKDQFSAVNRKLGGVLRAIENGAWNDSLKRRLEEQLNAAAKLDTSVRLHPNAAALYAAKVAELQAF